MALFNDTRELSRQESNAGLNRVQGQDKATLAMLGYKDDGTRNAWGKFNPLIGGGVTNAIAAGVAKGTDTGDTLKASQGVAWNNTLNKAAFAANIATMGSSSALLGGVSKGLNMASGSGASGDLEGIIGDVTGKAKKGEAMDKLNAGSSESNPNANGSYIEQTVDGVPVGGTGGTEEEFQGWLKNNPEGTREIFDKLPRAAGESGMLSKAKGVLNTPGVGDAIQSGIGGIMSEVAYDQELKNNVITDGTKSMNTFNYL